MTRILTYVLASAAIALPATVRAQAAAMPDSAHRAMTKAEHKEMRKERRERAGKDEKHPEIRAAMRSLERAKADLERASHDYGGHRAEALKATEEAIKHVRLALESDKK